MNDPEQRSYAAVAGCAIDFLQALCEVSWPFRQLLRLAMGRYAYRELLELMEALREARMYAYLPYEGGAMDYHNQSLPTDFAEKARQDWEAR